MSELESQPVVISSSLDHVIADSTTDSKNMRLGIAVAMAAHVVLFAVNWPSLAGQPPDAHRKQPPVIVLRPFKYHIPPTPPPDTRIRPPARRIPVPGPPDQTPEPIRDDPIDLSQIDTELVYADDLDIPPPPPEQPPEIPIVGPEITAPKRIVTVNPVYPEMARKARMEGIVILSLIIGEDGRVRSVEVKRGLGLGLTDAAVEAARQWVFEPSTYRGRPTAVQYILTVQFHLD